MRAIANSIFPLAAALSVACGDPVLDLDAGSSSGGDEVASASTGSSGSQGVTTDPATATTTSDQPTTTPSSGSSSGETRADGSSSESSGGADETSGGSVECEPGTGWPASAAEALERSCAWSPDLQVEHRGTVTSSSDGEVIEDLHIVDGGIVIEHDGVAVRNVTSEGAIEMEGGTPPVTLAEGTSDTHLVGVLLGPSAPQWSAECGRPLMPFHGLYAGMDSSWQLDGVAFRLVPYAIRVTAGSTGSVVDAFIEMGRAAETLSGSCVEARSFGAYVAGEDASLAMTRTWVDAQPYSMLAEGGPVQQVEVTMSNLSMPLRTFGSGIHIDFDQVGMHAGRLAMDLFGGSLSLTNSESSETLFAEPIQVSGDLVISEWENNVRDGMPWEAPF